MAVPPPDDEPSDADIERHLQEAPAECWLRLWSAMAEVEGERVHSSWAGGEVVGTAAVDGVDRPLRTMPYIEYSEAVQRLMAALGVAIVPFTWRTWDGDERYRHGVGLDQAPVADAVRMVTMIIRSERFCDGTVEACLADGTLYTAVRRLRRWHDEEQSAAP